MRGGQLNVKRKCSLEKPTRGCFNLPKRIYLKYQIGINLLQILELFAEKKFSRIKKKDFKKTLCNGLLQNLNEKTVSLKGE